MRIKIDDTIKEVKKIVIRNNDIILETRFFKTRNDTAKIGKQLLEKGYADLTEYEYY